MHVYYSDIIESEQGQKPTWYMTNGVPRFCDFGPNLISVYADYSVLYLVGCQSCNKEFLVGEEYTRTRMTMQKIDVKALKSIGINVHIPDEDDYWLYLQDSLFAPTEKDEKGHTIFKQLTIKEVIERFHMGDPPCHGCAGDTMNSVPLETVQVWDLHHGRVIEKNENGFSTIVEWGKAARLPEYEKMDLKPDWFTKN